MEPRYVGLAVAFIYWFTGATAGDRAVNQRVVLRGLLAALVAWILALAVKVAWLQVLRGPEWKEIVSEWACWQGLPSACPAAAVGFALLYLVAVVGEKAFKKEAMGGGDIKMMAMVGAFVGWKGVLLTIFGGSLLGTLVFAPLLLFKVKRLVPFGVFLAAAAAVAFVFGDTLIDWYLQWVLG